MIYKFGYYMYLPSAQAVEPQRSVPLTTCEATLLSTGIDQRCLTLPNLTIYTYVVLWHVGGGYATSTYFHRRRLCLAGPGACTATVHMHARAKKKYLPLRLRLHSQAAVATYYVPTASGSKQEQTAAAAAPCPAALSPVSSPHKCSGDGLVGAINYTPPPLDLPALLPHPPALPVPSVHPLPFFPLCLLLPASRRRRLNSLLLVRRLVHAHLVLLSVPTTSSTAPSSSS